MLVPSKLLQMNTEDVPSGANSDLKLFWLQVRYKRVNMCKSQREEKTDIGDWSVLLTWAFLVIMEKYFKSYKLVPWQTKKNELLHSGDHIGLGNKRKEMEQKQM